MWGSTRTCSPGCCWAIFERLEHPSKVTHGISLNKKKKKVNTQVKNLVRSSIINIGYREAIYLRRWLVLCLKCLWTATTSCIM